jgi:alpha-glucuronidase
MSVLNAIPKEDGYELWLRYRLVQPAELLKAYRQQVYGVGNAASGGNVVVPGDSPTVEAIRSEMQRGLAGLLGEPVDIGQDCLQQGGVLIGTPASSPQIVALDWQTQIEAELGALYGAFHLLRLLQTHQPLTNLDITERPRIQYRVLNHWDNLDGSIERGYAGRSLWKWKELPDVVDPRYSDYARACASIGINAASLNNTNARSESLSTGYLRKAAAVGCGYSCRSCFRRRWS